MRVAILRLLSILSVSLFAGCESDPTPQQILYPTREVDVSSPSGIGIGSYFVSPNVARIAIYRSGDDTRIIDCENNFEQHVVTKHVGGVWDRGRRGLSFYDERYFLGISEKLHSVIIWDCELRKQVAISEEFSLEIDGVGRTLDGKHIWARGFMPTHALSRMYLLTYPELKLVNTIEISVPEQDPDVHGSMMPTENIVRLGAPSRHFWLYQVDIQKWSKLPIPKEHQSGHPHSIVDYRRPLDCYSLYNPQSQICYDYDLDTGVLVGQSPKLPSKVTDYVRCETYHVMHRHPNPRGLSRGPGRVEIRNADCQVIVAATDFFEEPGHLMLNRRNQMLDMLPLGEKLKIYEFKPILKE